MIVRPPDPRLVWLAVSMLLLCVSPLAGQGWPTTISGRVVMENGSPPPEPVTIVRHCVGRSYIEGKTNSKGWFSLQLTSGGNLTMPDVEAPSSAVWSGSLGCDIRASLPGFQSQPRVLDRSRGLQIPDLGLIVLYPTSKIESPYVSITTLEAPPKARKAHEQALGAMTAKRPDHEQAAKLLRTAIKEHPRFAAAWDLLGQVQLKLGDENEARRSFQQSLQADSGYLPAHLPLLRMEVKAKRWDRAAQLAGQAILLDPRLSEARFAHALACLYLDRLDEAIHSARMLQQSEDAATYPQTHHILGMIYADRKDYRAATAEFRALIELQPQTKLAQNLKQQLRQWADSGLI